MGEILRTENFEGQTDKQLASAEKVAKEWGVRPEDLNPVDVRERAYEPNVEKAQKMAEAENEMHGGSKYYMDIAAQHGVTDITDDKTVFSVPFTGVISPHTSLRYDVIGRDGVDNVSPWKKIKYPTRWWTPSQIIEAERADMATVGIKAAKKYDKAQRR